MLPLGSLAAITLAANVPAPAVERQFVPSSQVPERGGQQRGADDDQNGHEEAQSPAAVDRTASEREEGAKNACKADEKLAELPFLGSDVTRGDVKSLITILLSAVGSFFALFSIYNADRTFRLARFQARGRIVVVRGRVRRDDASRVHAVDLILRNVGGTHMSDVAVTIGHDHDAREAFGACRLEEVGGGESVFVRLSAKRPLPWCAPLTGPLVVRVDARDHLKERTVERRTLRAVLRNRAERLTPAERRYP